MSTMNRSVAASRALSYAAPPTTEPMLPRLARPSTVHVNCIAPGIFPDVVTSGEERLKQSIERTRTSVPLGRPGKLREVGLLALYLASDASDYMTGQTIMLDGGMSL